LHMQDGEDEHKVTEIVDNLNSKLFFHGHPIYYKEAMDLGLKVSLPTDVEKELIWKLYLAYDLEMHLDEEFRFLDQFQQEKPDLQNGQSEIIDLPKMTGVYIESDVKTDIRTIDFQVLGIKDNNGVVQAQLLTKRMGWEIE